MKIIEVYKNHTYCCIIAKQDKIVSALNGIGVRPIITTFDLYPEMLKNAQVADKIIGKAAAMLLVQAGVSYVYGHTMSIAADKYLTEKDIPHSHGQLVPMIQNRTQSGMCPMELSVLETDDCTEGITAIRAFIAKMMALKAEQSL